MKVHWKIVAHGKVQGVFFRANTKEVAEALNIAGHVRNEPDGTVTIEAEGYKDAMEQLYEWCRTGPDNAEVTKVERQQKDLTGMEGFTIGD